MTYVDEDSYKNAACISCFRVSEDSKISPLNNH